MRADNAELRQQITKVADEIMRAATSRGPEPKKRRSPDSVRHSHPRSHRRRGLTIARQGTRAVSAYAVSALVLVPRYRR